MGTADSLSISHIEKPSQNAPAFSTLEKTSVRKDEETISNISIVHATDIDYMKEKVPAPEFDTTDKYFHVVGQICNYEEKLPADVAVRN